MQWNVIVTVNERGYRPVRRLLREYGRTARSGFFNVMVMQVADTTTFLEAMHTLYAHPPPALNYVGRIIPVSRHFRFQSPAEFEERARQALLPWLDALSGRHFYLRMHRRGFKGRLSSQQEECLLDTFVLQSLAERGATAKVDFAGAERVIALETLGQEAGLSLWSREQLERYPFLKLA